ncbi:MAG: AI-2E family transporter [Clostridiales bacterium]|nr:AI-2E family transporter [Clostridiales bacterium]
MVKAIKKSLQKYMGPLLVVLIAIILYNFITTVQFNAIAGEIISLMKPFIFGLIIAYILNPIVRFFEARLEYIDYFWKRPKLNKGLSMLLTYLLVAALIVFMIVSIIPEIISSIQGITAYLFTYIPKLETAFNAAAAGIEANGTAAEELINTFTSSINSVFDTILNSIKYIPNFISTLLTGTFNVAGWLLNFIIGVIISLYMLLDKKNLVNFCKKVSYIILPESYYEGFRSFVKDANKTFEKFFISKAVDSIIIAVIFFFGCCFISPDYALLFACVIGITNMIPYFGPFIGAVPVVLLCLLQDPYSAVWMIIFIIVLQQFDGYILGPRVMGDSIGIKPMGVIFAILVGGWLFGFIGMFFGVPLYAVISKTINNYVDKKAEEKRNTVYTAEEENASEAEGEEVLDEDK